MQTFLRVRSLNLFRSIPQALVAGYGHAGPVRSHRLGVHANSRVRFHDAVDSFVCVLHPTIRKSRVRAVAWRAHSYGNGRALESLAPYLRGVAVRVGVGSIWRPK